MGIAQVTTALVSFQKYFCSKEINRDNDPYFSCRRDSGPDSSSPLSFNLYPSLIHNAFNHTVSGEEKASCRRWKKQQSCDVSSLWSCRYYSLERHTRKGLWSHTGRHLWHQRGERTLTWPFLFHFLFPFLPSLIFPFPPQFYLSYHLYIVALAGAGATVIALVSCSWSRW